MSDAGNRWKWFGGVACVFVVLQFVPVERDNPQVSFEVPLPPDVKPILERSCYDCHSNKTKWPWYGHVAPVSWLISYDVANARSELNFTTWKEYRSDKRASLLRDVLEEIEEEAMPPWEYLWMHPEARLSEEERRLLRDWIGASED